MLNEFIQEPVKMMLCVIFLFNCVLQHTMTSLRFKNDSKEIRALEEIYIVIASISDQTFNNTQKKKPAIQKIVTCPRSDTYQQRQILKMVLKTKGVQQGKHTVLMRTAVISIRRD